MWSLWLALASPASACSQSPTYLALLQDYDGAVLPRGFCVRTEAWNPDPNVAPYGPAQAPFPVGLTAVGTGETFPLVADARCDGDPRAPVDLSFGVYDVDLTYDPFMFDTHPDDDLRVRVEVTEAALPTVGAAAVVEVRRAHRWDVFANTAWCVEDRSRLSQSVEVALALPGIDPGVDGWAVRVSAEAGNASDPVFMHHRLPLRAGETSAWVSLAWQEDGPVDAPPPLAETLRWCLEVEVLDPTGVVVHTTGTTCADTPLYDPPRCTDVDAPDAALAVDAVVGYRDADEDGVGVYDEVRIVCPGTPGFAVVDGDCDDTQGDVYPGAAERCDGLDNDCDGETDERCVEEGDPSPAGPMDGSSEDVMGEDCGCAAAGHGYLWVWWPLVAWIRRARPPRS